MQASGLTALSIIENGSDLLFAREKGADLAFLKKRKAALQELAKRSEITAHVSYPRAASQAAGVVVDTGEIYAFPTMNGYACHPYRLEQQGPFAGRVGRAGCPGNG